MSMLGEQVIDSARWRVGRPFLHHFKPMNECQGGTISVEGCMQKGLDDIGYDCSGLVLASLCDVLAIASSDWPADYRHLNQLKSMAQDQEPDHGDVLFFDPLRSNRTYHGAHMGIFVAKRCVIHASGTTGFVEEGQIDGDFAQITTLPIENLASLVLD